MAKVFTYTAVDGSGRESKGQLEADSHEAAVQHVRQSGLFPTSLDEKESNRPVCPKHVPTSKRVTALLAPRLKGKYLAAFTRQLATLLDAGMPLMRGLRLLQDQAEETGQKAVIGQVADHVEAGGTFSESLARQPRTFDRLFVSMIRAGEASGQLEQVLKRQAEFLEKRRRLARKVKGALAYPAMVCVVSLSITAGLMIFIVPKFAKMFEGMLDGAALPELTQIVMAASDILMHRIHYILVAALMAVALWKIIRALPAGTALTDRLALRLPGYGNLARLTASAQFCTTLGTLVQSGVGILNALLIVRDSSGNSVVANAVQRIHDAVKEGEGISQTMAATGAFPKMLVGMVQVGEETGALPEMLARVSTAYEEEVDSAVEALTSMIEPALIVLLAGLVGTIVIALFLPLIRLITIMTGG
ncbi:MAG: type II secretion system F family protein [Lentisphaeria bacterium]|nr:type II secretion system F family protein [Lentisphaeria bacterium]